jgi:hypothetical protein
MPVEALACHNPLYYSLDRSVALNLYVSTIVGSCVSAANATLPSTGINKRHRVPGWSEQVEPVISKSIWWHNILVD